MGEKQMYFEPCFLNIFIGDIMDYVNEGNFHAPTIGNTTIPRSLFEDHLAY
jgi:hypothetical protein